MSKPKKRAKDMFAVIEARWIPQGYFDTREEAEKYRDYCARNFVGGFSVQRVDATYPRRFFNATVGAEARGR